MTTTVGMPLAAEYDWYSPSMAAPLLGISDESVRRLIQTGQLPATIHRIGAQERPRYKILGSTINRYHRINSSLNTIPEKDSDND